MESEIVFDEHVIAGKTYSSLIYRIENLIYDPKPENIKELQSILNEAKEKDINKAVSLICNMYQMLSVAKKIRPFQTLELSKIVRFVIQYEDELNSQYNIKKKQTNKLQTKNRSIRSIYNKFIQYKTFNQTYAELIYGKDSLAAIISNDDVEKLAYNDVREPISALIIEDSSKKLSCLAFAAFSGSLKVFKYIVINYGITLGDDLLTYAIIGGNEEILEIISGNDISFKGHAKTAMKYHRNEIAKWIIENYDDHLFSLKSTIKYSNTLAFFYINAYYKQEIPNYTDALLDPNIRASKNCVFLAIESNRIDFLEEFIDAGASFDIKHPYQTDSLFLALSFGFLDIAELLISRGVNLTRKSATGATALYVCCESGYTNICKKIIEKGGDVNAKNKKGETPLLVSLQKHYFDIAQLLLDNGANINVKNNRGETLLCIASSNNEIEVATFLLDHGADVEIPTTSGFTPYYCAIIQGNFDIMELLLSRCTPSFDPKTRTSEEALFKAISKNQIKSVKYLLDSGVNIECLTNINQLTPLAYACSIQKPDIVELLLKYECNIESIDLESHTPLWYAYFNGCTRIIDMLLKSGATDLIY